MNFRFFFRLVLTVHLLVMPFAAFANSCADLLAARPPSPREKIQQFISDKKEVTFEDAIAFAKDTLPSDLRSKLNEKLEENIYGRDIRITNQTGWRSRLGSSDLRINGRLRQPLTGYENRRGKVTWKARVAKSESDFLNLVFDSIRIVFKPDLAPITSMAVLYKSRNKEIADLLETANEVIQLEFSVTEQAFDSEAPSLIARDSIGSKIRRWLQYLTILPGGTTPWRYDRVVLDRSLFDALIGRNDAIANEILRKKLAPGTSVQWFTKHLINFRRAVLVSLVIVIGPEAWSAADYQWTVENLGLSELTRQELQVAREFAQEIDGDLYRSIKVDLDNIPKGNLSESEIDLLRAVEQVVDARISEAGGKSNN